MPWPFVASTESLHIFILSPAILIGQRLRTVSKAIKKAANRPDIVARVFQLKLKELIKDIQKNQILGVVGARIHVIEFQKRGLSHVHMLIWIHESDVPKTEEEIDKTTCAEIPDPDTHPELHKIIMSSMIHGPCGTNNRNSP